MSASQAVDFENGHLVDTSAGQDRGAEEDRTMDGMIALRRLVHGIDEHKVTLRKLQDGLTEILENLTKPGIGERAIPAAICLGREFEAGIRALEGALADAIDADPAIERMLAPETTLSAKRFAYLRRLAAPVHHAIDRLIDPTEARVPFSLIHDGLELIEGIKRHRRWLNHAVLSIAASRYENLTGAAPLPLDPPAVSPPAVSPPAVSTVAAEPPCGHRRPDPIESRVHELVRDLEIRSGLRLVPKTAPEPLLA